MSKTTVGLACEQYLQYFTEIFTPATSEFLKTLDTENVKLHQVFGANLFVAHALDYILAIRKADGIAESRKELVKKFDAQFSIDGGRFRNKKFTLIDAVNNALKHIQVSTTRYPGLFKEYGAITFSCLTEKNGRTLCVLDKYRFDYSRVVLRPAIRALSGWEFDDLESVRTFARGNTLCSDVGSNCTSDDPIDQMIEHCNPVCNDCGEGEHSCLCGTYLYEGGEGRFSPNFNENFEFNSVMYLISGAYRKN